MEILLVDDNPTDVRIMQEALETASIAGRLHTVRDGVEALAFLRGEGPFQDAPVPNLILLDLMMPRKGGLEVLADIKADPNLRDTPTIILTSSKEEDAMVRAFKLQANGFVRKPMDYDDFVAVMGGIEEYWTGVAGQSKPSPA